MPKITLGITDGKKFGVGISGLKNPIGDLRFRLIYVPSRSYKSAFSFFHYSLLMYRFMQCICCGSILSVVQILFPFALKPLSYITTHQNKRQ